MKVHRLPLRLCGLLIPCNFLLASGPVVNQPPLPFAPVAAVPGALVRDVIVPCALTGALGSELDAAVVPTAGCLPDVPQVAHGSSTGQHRPGSRDRVLRFRR